MGLRNNLGSIANFLTRWDVGYKFRKIYFAPRICLPSNSETIVIFACFKLNVLEFDFLRKLSEAAPSTFILVIDNARERAPFQFEGSISYHNRTNISRDLGTLRDMAQRLSKAQSPSNILFINSSCSWEPNLLGQYVTGLSELSQEIVFATDSYQPKWHIQSYFMWISKDVCDLALSALAKKSFIKNWKFKRSVVYRGEKQLAQQLIAANLKISILFPAVRFLTEPEISFVNPSLTKYQELVDSGAPFVKKTSLSSRCLFNSKSPADPKIVISRRHILN